MILISSLPNIPSMTSMPTMPCLINFAMFDKLCHNFVPEINFIIQKTNELEETNYMPFYFLQKILMSIIKPLIMI